jgi:hypothetical protein
MGMDTAFRFVPTDTGVTPRVEAMETDERRKLRPDTSSHLGIPTPAEEKPVMSYGGMTFKK